MLAERRQSSCHSPEAERALMNYRKTVWLERSEQGGNDVRQDWRGLLGLEQRWSSTCGWHTFPVGGPNGKYLRVVGQLPKLKIFYR